MSSSSPVLDCRNLCKRFEDGANRVEVLRAINLSVARGEKLAIVGASGSGKSTLLQLMGGLDHPTDGEVLLYGQSLYEMSENRRSRLRGEQLGFIYQFHHLLPEFTALENVMMPLWIQNRSGSEARQRATELLQQVGLEQRLHHKPAALSGGERQRTAIARALVTRPAVVLADEPTGNLDRERADQAYQLMVDLNRKEGSSLVLVTHDTSLAQQMDRVVQLVDGVLQEGGLS